MVRVVVGLSTSRALPLVRGLCAGISLGIISAPLGVVWQVLGVLALIVARTGRGWMGRVVPGFALKTAALRAITTTRARQ